MSKLKNLMAIAEGFIDSKSFRKHYVNGIDVTGNGNLSCAYFATTVLSMAKLCEGVSTTVNGMLIRMERAEWYEIDIPANPKDIPEGAVIVWGSPGGEEGRRHIGFKLKEGDLAISHASSTRSPRRHGSTPLTEGKIGSIEKIFHHEDLKK